MKLKKENVIFFNKGNVQFQIRKFNYSRWNRFYIVIDEKSYFITKTYGKGVGYIETPEIFKKRVVKQSVSLVKV